VDVRIGGRGVLVDVRMSVLELAVAVAVHVVVAAVPAHQESRGDGDDHQPDRELGDALRGLRQQDAEDHDGQPEREQRRGMPQAPRKAEAPGAPRAVGLIAGHEHRDRRQVVGIGRVAQAEEQRDEEREHPAAAGEIGNAMVEAEHQAPMLAAATAAWP
jgi:hypothetical protein